MCVCVCVLQLQLLGEVRGVMRPADLDRYNELTVHREIAAKKVWFSLRTTMTVYYCKYVRSIGFSRFFIITLVAMDIR